LAIQTSENEASASLKSREVIMKKLISIILVLLMVSCEKDLPPAPELPILYFTLNGVQSKFDKSAIQVTCGIYDLLIMASDANATLSIALSLNDKTIGPGVYASGPGVIINGRVEKNGVVYFAGRNPNADGFLGSGRINLISQRGRFGEGTFEFSSDREPAFRVTGGYFKY